MIVYKFPDAIWGLFYLKKIIYLVVIQIVLLNMLSLNVYATKTPQPDVMGQTADVPAKATSVAAAATSTASVTGATTAHTPSVTPKISKPLTIKPKKLPEMVIPFEDEDDEYADEDDDDFYDITKNKSAKGMYIGAPCEFTCHAKLQHVFCDPATNICVCDKNNPVTIGITKGCSKREQCFYHQTCYFSDENSLCVQVKHNARCQCATGYHSVSYQKPTKRIFCTPDLDVITSDLPTLLGVTTGIAVLAGLICMVLHLFSKTKYPRPRNFGDASLAPPILFSSDAGIPLTIQSARPSSRSSQHSSSSIGSYGRRPSSAPPLPSKGVLVSTSRTDSRRPSVASLHSTSSSIRSYSIRRFEQELHQKELRQEMKKHLVRLQEQQQLQKIRPSIIIGDAIPCTITRAIITTPSPLTPNSTDELLPSVDETQEVNYF